MTSRAQKQYVQNLPAGFKLHASHLPSVAQWNMHTGMCAGGSSYITNKETTVTPVLNFVHK